MLSCGSGRDIITSRSCRPAALPEELTVPTLFGIAHGKVITPTLPIELSIDSTINFVQDIILERNVREV